MGPAVDRPWVGWAVVLGLAAAACGPSPPPNVLLLTVDTLRPDHLGYAGYERPTSPALDRLAAGAVRFERCYSQAGWTLPSVATILTGLYPSQHGATYTELGLHADVPTLAGILAARGYDTRAFVSHGFLQRRYGLESGFGHYDAGVLDIGEPQSLASGEPLTDRVLAAWEAIEPPFFLWVHYFDPHFEYLLHEEWVGFGDGGVDRYDSEIAHTDRQIGRLLDALEASGWADDTIVVFTADHGEEFGEHAGIFHTGLYEEDVRIPLLVRAPGVAPRLETAVAQQIDILPTVLDLVGIEADPALPGRVLVPPAPGERPVFMERIRPQPFRQQALVDGDWKIYRVEIVEEEARLAADRSRMSLSPGVRLYDLAADPGERHDLYREDDPVARRLLARLDALAALPSRQGRYVGADEETQRRLRSLGYID